MQFLKQSTAVTLKLGPFVDETDGFTAETGLTLSQADVRLSKNGGDMAQKAETSACTHDEIGIYDCPVDTTDTGTLGRLDVFVHESGARPVRERFMVMPANVWESLYGSDKLEVNVKEISDDSTAADNLETACDNYSATRGLAGTALPAAAADAAGGLPISDAGALDLDAKIGALTFSVAGDVDVNVQSWGGSAVATPTTAGVPEVDLTHIAGAAVSTTTAQLGVNVEKWNNSDVPAGDPFLV